MVSESLLAELHAAADATERDRRLAPPLVTAMAEAGLFAMCVPRRYGGGEAGPRELVETIERISRADGAAGWTLMIGATTGLVAAYLPEADAREIFADPRVVTGGVTAPKGRAVAVDGGWRVTGRWPFASGCQHCAWLLGTCFVVDESGAPRKSARGVPEMRSFFFPAADVRILDTWDVSGLRGTGSHDFEVADVLVPAGRSFVLGVDSPREPGPLYRFPLFGLLALGIAAVGLGIARSAIDELVALAADKTPTASRRVLGERALVQADVARAEALVGASRAFLLEAVDAAMARATRGDELTIGDRAQLRLAATHAATSSAAGVDLMYEAGGGTSVYATSRLQRCFRDAHVVTQHLMVAKPTLEAVGRVFLGLESDASML